VGYLKWVLVTASVIIVAGGVVSGRAALSGETVIISEFLANPTAGLETEWIELYNPSDSTIDLIYFKIGDKLGLHTISDTAIVVPAMTYVILVQDSATFHQYYPSATCPVIEPSGWCGLNNDGDLVRLTDIGGNVIDSVTYDKVFPDNRSWERCLDPGGRSFWGESYAVSGSSPCEANSFFYPRAEAVEISVSPDPFSPNGDGHEDLTTIRFNPPEAKSFDLCIYDVSGRKVKTFFHSVEPIPGSIVWDGRGDDNQRLPIGIYIIYAKTSDGQNHSTKKTVVIAR
jgi:hypothetical protein